MKYSVPCNKRFVTFREGNRVWDIGTGSSENKTEQSYTGTGKGAHFTVRY